MKIMLSLILLISSAFAETKSFKYNNFEEAENALSYVRFDMESTKAGLITTSFNGFAKTFKISYKKKSKQFKNVKAFVEVIDLDTDVNARNEKMHNLCFEQKKYPQLVVSLNEDLSIGMKKEVKATISVRGKDYPIKMKFKLSDEGENILFEGSSSVSLKSLLIPDPSIWIASVRDRVDLKFKFEIKK